MPPSHLSPNQLVGLNLTRARRMRGWTQEQAAERLAPYLGELWSKATFSSAERSFDGTRVRQFTADDLYAFSRAFDLPITYFLAPPAQLYDMAIGHANSTETLPASDYLDQVFDIGVDAAEWLLKEVVPITGPTTRALRRWGKNFAALVGYREREVEAFLADAKQGDRS